MDRRIKIGALVFVSILLIGGIGLYVGRNSLLNHYAKEKIETVEQEYGLDISYKKLYMPGISKVTLEQLCVVPHQRDTLLQLHSLEVDLNFWKMLRMQVGINRVTIDGINISFVKKDSLSNYDFLFKNKKNQTSLQKEEKSFSKRVSRVLDFAFGFLPSNGDIHLFTLSHRKDSNYTEVKIPAMHIENNKFSTEIIVKENNTTRYWLSKGLLHNGNKTIEAQIYSKTKGKVTLPYVSKYYGAQVAFDTLTYRLTETEKIGGEISLQGKAEVSGLSLYHKAISPEVIDLDEGKIDYVINVGKDYIELDNATSIKFNRLQFNPYIKATKKDKWQITVSVDKPSFPADELFSSLPKGLFSNLEGLKTTGNLSYHFLLDVDFNNLNNLKFESEMRQDNFRITGFGASNLSKMNGEFSYTAYENGRPVRTFAVGSSNPNFLPLDSISPLLQTAVMQSEDGGFYGHRGFLMDAMRGALIHDLKVKRFARGGSTITMQLVKNVFLNRNKNIARKLEEALIVWLIENEGLTSKHRMYEVYLNIAEWGPLVYGAKEAANYYFQKEPSQLTANEAIFMASIIPKPKHFRSSFGPDMQLKESLGWYYKLLARRLLAKGLISEEEAANIRPEIQVTGDAKNSFTAQPDSTTIAPETPVEEIEVPVKE